MTVHRYLHVAAGLRPEAVCFVLMDAPVEESTFHALQTAKPPHRVDHSIRQKLLNRPGGSQIGPNPIAEIFESLSIFSR